MPPEPLEKEIISYLHQQDREAIRLIFQHYRAALFGIICRIVEDEDMAEDLLQDALVKIWRNGPRYDSTKGRLFTWLLNICRNTAIDHRRSKAFKAKGKIQDIENIVSETDSSGPAYETATDGIGLPEMVKRLAPEHRELIHLVYFQGHTHQEAAKALDLPLGTVKSRVRKALMTLRTWVNQ